MLARKLLLGFVFIFSVCANATQIDYMRVKLKGDEVKTYQIDDIEKLTFPTSEEMAIVPYEGETIIILLDNLVRVSFTEEAENILYIDENSDLSYYSQQYFNYDAVIVAQKGESDLDINIGNNYVTTGRVLMYVDKDGVAPRVTISGEGFLNTNSFTVSRIIKCDMWTMMSLPFDVAISNITVNGNPAVINENIMLREYDGEQRASNSKEGVTVSGWKAKEEGTLKANKGFAIAINSDLGQEQEVRFTSTNFTAKANAITLQLERHPSEVNKRMDEDWNFIGNPTLSYQEKGRGYSAYIYNPEKDSYKEYSSEQAATYSPYSSFFVQSQDEFTEIMFATPQGRLRKTVAQDNDIITLDINGEDNLTILLNEESDKEYVRNEDALYMAPGNADLSQIYMIRNGIKMAVSEQPTVEEPIAIGYTAPKGNQTITVTTLPENMGVVLEDKYLGQEEYMAEGDSYTFNNTTTSNTNRFVMKLTELTGIESEKAESYKVYLSGNNIYVKGTQEGDLVTLYTVNGIMLQQTKAQSNTTELEVAQQGVYLVKVENEVFKVVKK